MELGDPENVEVYEVPVRYISVEFANHEDGGGISVIVRLDGVEPDKVLKVALTLLEKINGNGEKKKEELREVA